MEKLFNKNRKIYWKHIWNQQQYCGQIQVQERIVLLVRTGQCSVTNNRAVKQQQQQWTSKSLRDHIQGRPLPLLCRSFPPLRTQTQQNRADVDKQNGNVRFLYQREKEWVFASEDPKEKHTITHTTNTHNKERERERERSRSRPSLTTFHRPKV